jgi:hypothetical protein
MMLGRYFQFIEGLLCLAFLSNKPVHMRQPAKAKIGFALFERGDCLWVPSRRHVREGERWGPRSVMQSLKPSNCEIILPRREGDQSCLVSNSIVKRIQFKRVFNLGNGVFIPS